ncbi:MAG: hypothetical protein KDC52_15150, partial [Ignavibacteriae bacterium]|nr:hypothetical protein [Ignavibacteriota bacterium]
ANLEHIDMLINYSDLCEKPNLYIKNIISLWDIKKKQVNFPMCKCFDSEYLTGSRLLSKNRENRNTNELDLETLRENIEFPALTSEQIELIINICDKTWLDLQSITL